MTFGLTFEKLLLIGLIAVLIIGPERLPRAAEGFARIVRKAGEYLRDTKSRVREEMGPELDDVDWRKLDPRQYDPRRIIRDALLEEPEPATPAQATGSAHRAADLQRGEPSAVRHRGDLSRPGHEIRVRSVANSSSLKRERGMAVATEASRTLKITASRPTRRLWNVR
jgi:sec-independent protein translocase protein TatB